MTDGANGNTPASIATDLQSRLGPGTQWVPDQAPATTAWVLDPFDLVWAPENPGSFKNVGVIL